MEVLTFELCGKIAHFRKFYSNASALTYTIPPRTTILGILASILELPRDSYYCNKTEHNLDELLIGVGVNNSFKKVFQKMNYLLIKDVPKTDKLPSSLDIESYWDDRINQLSKFRGFGNRSQTATELIMPEEIRGGLLSYQIYVGVKNENKHFNLLKKRFADEYYPYGICLGSANFLGFLKREDDFVLEAEPTSSDSFINVNTAITSEIITEIDTDKDIEIEQDNYPLRFGIDSTVKANKPARIATEIKTLIYPVRTEKNHMRVKLSDYSNLFNIKNSNKNIFLM